jgi:uncharacterized membrane protein YhaH (DUF805 family)
MPGSIAGLFTLRGSIGPLRYFALGCGLVALKFGIDSLLCQLLFAKPWRPHIYLLPFDWLEPSQTRTAWQWMPFAAVSLPFLMAGVALSVRRLRDAGLPLLFVALFVVPGLNLLLFALLSVLPAPERAEPRQAMSAASTRLPSPPPRAAQLDGVGGALLAALLTAGLAWFGATVMQGYGATLFLALPFLQGFLVGVFCRDRGMRHSIRQFLLSMVFSALILLLIAMEGILCLLMAAPLWMLFGAFGTWVGQASAATLPRRGRVAPVLVLPLSMWVEPGVQRPPPAYEVTTEVVIAATPAVVWQHLVAVSDLPPPSEIAFRAGIAWPVRARIEGSGVGAMRYCDFSTGSLVEPIEVWDEPRLLRFAVLDNPQPMVEWNPFHDRVDAPHLHGWFIGKRGQFALTDRGDGTTLLAGTTWYSHGLEPACYWRWWSDWLVHTIHRRVFDHIKSEAERSVGHR